MAIITKRSPMDAAAQAALAMPFRSGRVAPFDNDPGFGLVLMSEVAARALSSTVTTRHSARRDGHRWQGVQALDYGLGEVRRRHATAMNATIARW
ncbi:hypothetical protein [Variovorax sp. LT1R16]|uniref:hypothetical protein n=1 Tax=Variovorax sp. LT1R16 TaxID=3443728 RepID=UPI003F49229D